MRVAVPGTLTTAYLTLKLFAPEIETVTVPFDKIIPEVVAGNFDAGLIIHEGQLTYAASGLHKVIDLGQWWREQTGLPLPLGGNAIRRSLGEDVMLTVTQALRDSIQHALDHREAALEYSMQFARDLDPQMANRFVSMYVNQRTLNYGEDGKEAIRKLLTMGHERGIIPIPSRSISSVKAEEVVTCEGTLENWKFSIEGFSQPSSALEGGAVSPYSSTDRYLSSSLSAPFRPQANSVRTPVGPLETHRSSTVFPGDFCVRAKPTADPSASARDDTRRSMLNFKCASRTGIPSPSDSRNCKSVNRSPLVIPERSRGICSGFAGRTLSGGRRYSSSSALAGQDGPTAAARVCAPSHRAIGSHSASEDRRGLHAENPSGSTLAHLAPWARSPGTTARYRDCDSPLHRPADRQRR